MPHALSFPNQIGFVTKSTKGALVFLLVIHYTAMFEILEQLDYWFDYVHSGVRRHAVGPEVPERHVFADHNDWDDHNDEKYTCDGLGMCGKHNRGPG
jgi:hypothetical protein